jgi:hypothetical protein
VLRTEAQLFVGDAENDASDHIGSQVRVLEPGAHLQECSLSFLRRHLAAQVEASAASEYQGTLAEAAPAESRAGQQATRAADLVRALEMAGYAQVSAAAQTSV